MTQHLSPQERIAAGQSQRKRMRRADHAGWNPKARTTDPLELLADSMRGRVPALIDVKYERMAASPFGFFRGAVPIMACDLSLGMNTGLYTQLCGDAHVRNLGAFAGPDGRLVFDINDFDETIRGPFEWDVKRMAASLIVAGREFGARNGHCRDAARTFLSHYRTMMHLLAQMPVLELARFQVHRLHSIQPVSQMLRAAERATPLHNLERLTEPARQPNEPATSELKQRSGEPQRIFKTIAPDLTRVDAATARRVIDSLATYAETLQPERRHFLAQYTPVDVAFKIVGTGSVGLRDYCIYMEGNGENDPLFLQIKEEVQSAYSPYLGDVEEPHHEGQRVAFGQRAMQLQSDPFLGWTTIEGRDYLVRQLNDHKAAIEPKQLRSAGLLDYAAVCGETLARGHARAGDPCVLAGYIGTSARFDQAIVEFAVEYATQTERDWEALVRSRKQVTNKPAQPESGAEKKRRSGQREPAKQQARKHENKRARSKGAGAKRSR